MSSQNESKRRPLRVPENIWLPAKERAAREGTNISRVINEFLLDYGRPGVSTEEWLERAKKAAEVEQS